MDLLVSYFQYDSDISAYTYERTLDMEKRAKVLQELKLKNRRHTVSWWLARNIDQ